LWLRLRVQAGARDREGRSQTCGARELMNSMHGVSPGSLLADSFCKTRAYACRAFCAAKMPFISVSSGDF
jgi:hypothetical protein